MADENYSAVSRVFEVTELRDMIFSYIYGLPPSYWNPLWENNHAGSYFVRLMHVNKFWSSVAAPYAWRRCGYRPGPFPHDLVKLSGDPNRLQWYANFIQDVRVDYGFEIASSRDPVERVLCLRTQLGRLLPEIEFPGLRNIRLLQSGMESLTIPFIGQNLKELWSETPNHSIDFWTALKVSDVSQGTIVFCSSILQQRSSKLELLVLNSPDEQHMDEDPETDSSQSEQLVLNSSSRNKTESGLVALESFHAFLSSAERLERLQLIGRSELWSVDTFLHIASLPNLILLNLSSLDLSHADGEWVEMLHNSKFQPFKSLSVLLFSTTTKGLDLMLPFLAKVTDLEVRVVGGLSVQHLRAIHHLSSLQSLELVPSGINWSIEGEALLEIAKHCTQLVSFRVGTPFDDPIMSYVNDSIIEAFARALPNLAECSFHGDFSGLTEDSILYFSKYCKSLKYLIIPADIDAIRLARHSSTGMFPELEAIVVYQSRRDDQRLDSYKEFKDMTARIVDMMPKCYRYDTVRGRRTWFSFPDGERLCIDDAISENLKTSVPREQKGVTGINITIDNSPHTRLRSH